jgi:hypothetical protein
MIDRAMLEELSNTVKDAELELREEILRAFPVGRLVKIQYGGKWVGPYEITVHQFGDGPYGPAMIGRNPRTGKTRKLGTFESLRAFPEEC